MGPSNSRVEIFADHVDKYADDPEAMACKYSAVHDIALANDFVAPKVLEIFPNRIRLERIRLTRSLRELYVGQAFQPLSDATRRAGEVLACLHRDLPRSGGIDWKPDLRFQQAIFRYGANLDYRSLPSATLHGDYSFANVFVGCSEQSISIIDPCANYGSTFDDWTSGPVYIDVGKMLACLEGQVPFRQMFRRRPAHEVKQLQREFVDGYSCYGEDLDLDIARAFAFAVVSAQFCKRYGRLSVIPRSALYNRFRRNFPSSPSI